MKKIFIIFLLFASCSFLISCDDKCDRNLYTKYSSQLSTEMNEFIPYKLGDTLVLKDSLGNRMTYICDKREITTDTIITPVYSDGKLCYTDKEFRKVLKVNLLATTQTYAFQWLYFYCYINMLETGKTENVIRYDTYEGGGKVFFYSFQNPCDGAVYMSCQDTVTANNILYRNIYVFGKDSRNDNHEYLFWDKKKGLVKLQSYRGPIWERVN